MRELETYNELINRHAGEINARQTKDRELLVMTARVFIAGHTVDKHPDCRAIGPNHGVTPCLLWRSELVADQAEPGIILVNRNRYPLTPVLESELRQKGWVRVERVNEAEDAWLSRNALGEIVRRSLNGEST